jgi:hypothetical protein
MNISTNLDGIAGHFGLKFWFWFGARLVGRIAFLVRFYNLASMKYAWYRFGVLDWGQHTLP